MATLTLKKPLAELPGPRMCSEKQLRRELLRVVKPITAIEKRKMNRLIGQAIALEILRGGNYQLRALDEVLMPTHRVLQRWAVSIGMGLPSDSWDDRKISKPPPLDDATATVVDNVICRGNDGCRRFVRDWYRTPTPVSAMCGSMGMDTKGIYMQWRASLFYYRGRFLATGHQDLVKMMEDFNPVY